ncbi:MAG: hypothetical protein AAFZ18_05545 [Myxococcota bacterium]
MRALHSAFLVPAVALAGLLASCGNECDRALDCASNQVCLRGTCIQSSASYIGCAVDTECGFPNSGLSCVAGRCTFTATMPVVMDAGTSTASDAGTGDAGP